MSCLRENFTFRLSAACRFVFVLVMSLLIAFTPYWVEMATDEMMFAILAGVLVFVLTIVLAAVMTDMPCSFEAGENEVTFKVLWFRRVIRYEDITDIEVTQEYSDPFYTRERPYYREDIVFKTKTGDISYWRKMDIELYDTVSDPSSLQKQLEDGAFVKLRKYILARKA